jgi:hypothetical protein
MTGKENPNAELVHRQIMAVLQCETNRKVTIIDMQSKQEREVQILNYLMDR